MSMSMFHRLRLRKREANVVCRSLFLKKRRRLRHRCDG